MDEETETWEIVRTAVLICARVGDRDAVEADLNDPNRCVIWQPFVYDVPTIDHARGTFDVRRIVYEKKRGERVPKGKVVLSSICENTRCINPWHSALHASVEWCGTTITDYDLLYSAIWAYGKEDVSDILADIRPIPVGAGVIDRVYYDLMTRP